MSHFLRVKEVEQADIDLHNDGFLLSPPVAAQTDPKLLESIKEFGLLNPPVLLSRDGRYHQIVTGWHRIAAFAELFPGRPIACLVAGNTLKDADCLAFALEDILLQRPPTAIETAVFLKKMTKFKEPQYIINAFSARLGLPRSTKIIPRYLGLLELEEPLLHAVHDKLLDERIAFELGELSMRDRLAFFNVVEQLRLSVSNQKKLLSGIRELAIRRESSIMAILSAARVSEILNHPTANVPQKTAMLTSWLERQRFPRLSKAEDDFRQMLKELRLPPNITLSHAPAFEKDSLILNVTCANHAELIAVLAAIEKITPALSERGS